MTDLPAEAVLDREAFGLYDTRSAVIVPLSVEKGKIFGLLTFAVTREEREWIIGFRSFQKKGLFPHYYL